MLQDLKTQASIFRLAGTCAGLHLKPAKCVLIISACNLSEHLVASIRNWLIINLPAFKDIIIAESGQFLGWYLGRQSATLSFAAPVKKSVNRVHEIVMGSAPSTVSIIRYNQRAVPVLSYVSKFTIPPQSVNLEALAHRSIHSILHLPPQTFSRALTNTVGFCSSIDPHPFQILLCCCQV